MVGRAAMRAMPMALAAAFLPACAHAGADYTGFSGLLDGSFDYTRMTAGKSTDADQYTAHAATLYTFDNPGLALQIDGTGDFYFQAPHSPAHFWSTGLSLFWRDNKGTFGVSGSYFTVDRSAPPLFSGRKSVESFGVFGEYYILDDLTLQARGGGTLGSVGGSSYSGSGGLTWYESRDFAFHSEIDYTGYSAGRDWYAIDSNVEFMPFPVVPLSFYAGYEYANIARGGDASSLYAGLKLRFGSGAALRDYQRTGAIEWTGRTAPGAGIRY